MLVLDNLTSPEHAHQFSRLVMYTVDKVYLHQTMGPPLTPPLTHIACRSLREQYQGQSMKTNAHIFLQVINAINYEACSLLNTSDAT